MKIYWYRFGIEFNRKHKTQFVFTLRLQYTPTTIDTVNRVLCRPPPDTFNTKQSVTAAIAAPSALLLHWHHNGTDDMKRGGRSWRFDERNTEKAEQQTTLNV